MSQSPTFTVSPALKGLEPNAFNWTEGLSILPRGQLEFRLSNMALKRKEIESALFNQKFAIRMKSSRGYRTFVVWSTKNDSAVDRPYTIVPLVSEIQRTLDPIGVSQDSRVFKGMTPLRIVEQIFREHGLKTPLRDPGVRDGEPLEHLVMYKESPLELVCRIIEELNLGFRFDRDRFVIFDGKAGFSGLPNHGKVRSGRSGEPLGERELQWTAYQGRTKQSARVSATSYDWRRPRAENFAERSYGDVGGRPWSTTHLFEHGRDPARVADAMRDQIAMADAGFAYGTSGVREFVPGGTFSAGQSLRLIGVTHSAENGIDGSNPTYQNEFHAIPSKTIFSAPRNTRQPKVDGPQVGTVVAEDGSTKPPKGNPVVADRYGRVKVRFGFDRAWKESKDESVWVRVTQPLVGNSAGTVFLPTVGTEVRLLFDDNNPDLPFIIACLPNPVSNVPFDPAKHSHRICLLGRPDPNAPVPANGLILEDDPNQPYVQISSRRELRGLAEIIQLEADGTLILRARKIVGEADDSISFKVGDTYSVMTPAEGRHSAGKLYLNCPGESPTPVEKIPRKKG